MNRRRCPECNTDARLTDAGVQAVYNGRFEGAIADAYERFRNNPYTDLFCTACGASE
jgi:hypothetical protein